VLVHWQTRKHALANMKAPWRGEALRELRISMQQTLLRCIRAGAVVQPSLYEGFGLLVEAVHDSLKSLV
jgi:hypothetical protein